MKSFSTFPAARAVEPELMDDPALDPAAHRAALAGLRRLNAASGTAGTLARTLAPVLKNVPADRVPRVLDVACGGGDGAVALGRRLRARLNRSIRVDGADLSPTALEAARGAAGRAGHVGEFYQADARTGPLPGAGDGGRYDAAVCSLFLHHFDDEDAGRVLKNMAAAAGCVVVSDLRRTRTGLVFAHAACRLLSRSPVVHADGPQSVRAAFTMNEFRRVADAAGLAGGTLAAAWPQRFLFVWRGEGR